MLENLFGFIGGSILVILTSAIFLFVASVGVISTIKILLSLIVGLISITIIFKIIRYVEIR